MSGLDARCYDVVQAALGGRRSRARVAAAVAECAPGRVLDVGAGTGWYARAVPRSAEYVAVDVDAVRLERLHGRRPGSTTVVGDATDLPFPDESFDLALCIALAHHLPDDGLVRLVDELARVAARIVLLDPLWSGRVASRVLWRLDRGAYPRSQEELTDAIRRRFTIVSTETYRVVHEYLLCVASPNGDRFARGRA